MMVVLKRCYKRKARNRGIKEDTGEKMALNSSQLPMLVHAIFFLIDVLTQKCTKLGIYLVLRICKMNRRLLFSEFGCHRVVRHESNYCTM